MDTMRASLVNVINELNKILQTTADPGRQDRILKVLTVLHALLDEVVRKIIDKKTAEYAAALVALKRAETSAEAAVADLAKTAEAIKMAVEAAKATDKVVQLFAGTVV